MLFYSSEKYPKEDEYSKFISEHGGFCNAFTSAEDTNYHFDVNSGDFAEALDRFAQFFVAPLISKDGVGREINAVNSENSKNLNSDVWRNMQLWRHLSKPDHAFHKFGTGSIDTLSRMPKEKGKDTHEEMTETVVKINEKLNERGKCLNTVEQEEFRDIAQSVGLKEQPPPSNN